MKAARTILQNGRLIRLANQSIIELSGLIEKLINLFIEKQNNYPRGWSANGLIYRSE